MHMSYSVHSQMAFGKEPSQFQFIAQFIWIAKQISTPGSA